MGELETAIMANAWDDILGRFNSTSFSLHDPTVSLNRASALLAWLYLTCNDTILSVPPEKFVYL